MAEEQKSLSIYDSEDKILEMMMKTTDPDEMDRLANALSKVHSSIVDEATEALKLEIEQAKADIEKQRAENEKESDKLRLDIEQQRADIEQQRAKDEKKGRGWQLAGTILAALIGAGAGIGAQWMKGEKDLQFQEEGQNREKTDTVIYNHKKWRR